MEVAFSNKAFGKVITMKRIGLIIVFLAGLLVAFPSSGATSNVVRFVATNSCNSFQANAVLQGQIHGIWSDVSPVAGWLPSGNCPDNSGVPWTMANIAAGTKIRWHIFPSDNSWVFYTPTQSAPLSSCSPKGTTIIANGRLYTCVASGKKLAWNSGATAPTTTTTLYAPFTVPTLSTVGPDTSCELPYTGPVGGNGDGFPLNQHGVPTTGTDKVLLLFVDFVDERKSDSSIAGLAQQYQEASAFYASDSYGKLNLQITAYPHMLHLSTNSASYGMNINSLTVPTNVQGLLNDGVTAAIQAGVDVSAYNSVYVLSPSDNPNITFGPALQNDISTIPGAPTVLNAVAGNGGDQGGHSKPWIWLAHEFSNQLRVEEPWARNYGNPWGIEGAGGETNLTDGSTPPIFGVNHLGYNKWLLGWLSDSQVACIDATTAPSGTYTYDLTPIETADSGTKIAVVKLNSHKLLVVEYRANAGMDVIPAGYTGAYVYTVDTSINTNYNIAKLGNDTNNVAFIPLGTKQLSLPNQLWDADTISTGQSVTYQGGTISVVGMNANNLYVKVTTTPSS